MARVKHARGLAFGALCALPFVAVALAGARPLHELPGRHAVGIVVALAALVAAWHLAGAALRRGDAVARTLALAGACLLLPWLLIGLLWTGLGAPFQASAAENHDRFVVLEIAALAVGAGFVLLHDGLRDLGGRGLAGLAFAASLPASTLYLACIALTLAQATMALQGDRTPVPALIDHLYDVLEFFACLLTYAATALYALAASRIGVLGRVAARVVAGVCLVLVALSLLRGIEYPEISGLTAPWYTQPGVIARIPAIPWLMPGLLGAWLLRFAGARAAA